FAEANKFLQNTKTPFFLWVHILPPHAPYSPPEKFRDIFLKDPGFNENSTRSLVSLHYLPEQQSLVDKLRARYDENILYADNEFGNFIERLQRNRYLENSILIVSTDHGESFEKGYLSHGSFGHYLYQPLIHIPLLIHLPGQKQGKVITSNAEQIDIAPTILDLLGIDIPAWMEGESLKKAMFNNYVTTKPKFAANSLELNYINRPITKGGFAVIKDNYKYIYDIQKGQGGELYDLEKDPEEQNNLVKKEKERAADLKGLIIEKIQTVNRNYQ
ncbi:MAG: sulfatase-like hydrolase/transferase, partial [Candidatus Omnitrophota bacterium]